MCCLVVPRDDNILGGQGDDYLIGGSGDDRLSGGHGVTTGFLVMRPTTIRQVMLIRLSMPVISERAAPAMIAFTVVSVATSSSVAEEMTASWPIPVLDAAFVPQPGRFRHLMDPASELDGVATALVGSQPLTPNMATWLQRRRLVPPVVGTRHRVCRCGKRSGSGTRRQRYYRRGGAATTGCPVVVVQI